jgi:hypothetical protein
MSNNSTNKPKNGINIFGTITNAVSGVVNTATNVISGNRKNKKNNTRRNSKNMVKNSMLANGVVANGMLANGVVVKPVTAGVNAPIKGGAAPVNFRYPANMQQPSEEIMEWATTAGAPTPISGMRNVAHGGKRSTHRHKKSHKKSHHKKSHKKSHHKKRTLRRKSVKRNRRN